MSANKELADMSADERQQWWRKQGRCVRPQGRFVVNYLMFRNFSFWERKEASQIPAPPPADAKTDWLNLNDFFEAITNNYVVGRWTGTTYKGKSFAPLSTDPVKVIFVLLKIIKLR